MYIELHYKKSPYIMNTERVIAINTNGDTGCLITLGTSDKHGKITTQCDESYDEVKQMILGSECNVEKTDPRVDQSKQLFWGDLMGAEFIGQPIWDSIRREWFLVVDSALDNRNWLELVDSSGKQIKIEPIHFGEYLFYPMKVKPLQERLLEVLKEVRGEI